MSARQDNSLDVIAQAVTDLVPELEPRLIDPSPETQSELGITGEMLLARVGAKRVIAVAAASSGKSWAIREFDTTTGDLDVVWAEEGDVADEQVPGLVLAAAIGSLEEQLTWKGATAIGKDIRPAITGLLTMLRDRQQELNSSVA